MGFHVNTVAAEVKKNLVKLSGISVVLNCQVTFRHRPRWPCSIVG